MHYAGMRKIDVREVLRREFECKVLGIVAIGVEEETGKVYLKLYGAAVDEAGEPLPVPDPPGGSPCEGGSDFTPGNFIKHPFRPEPTDEQLAAWAQQVFDKASAGLPVLLAAVAIEYLEGVAHLLQATDHPDDWDEEEVIKDHLKQIEYYLRSLLEATKRGKRSRWTSKELERAVRRALIGLPTRERKLDKVAEKLREIYPDRAPVSGEALGVLLKRFKLSWRKMKTDS
jgi:hypothetical protein